MIEFTTIKEARDLLASIIAAEAKRDGALLSELEHKMLYYSETDWTLPDMAAVSAEFDRDCDANEYEQKIARLVQKIETRNLAQNPVEEEAWDEPLLTLSEGDHYLSILITAAREAHTVRPAFIPTLDPPTVRPPPDRLMLWVTAFAIVIGLFAWLRIYAWLFGH